METFNPAQLINQSINRDVTIFKVVVFEYARSTSRVDPLSKRSVMLRSVESKQPTV